MFYLTDLSSDRLTYKPLSHLYDKDWARFLSNSQNTAFYPQIPVTNPERADLWIQSQLDRYKSGTFGMCAVHLTDTDEFIGQAGALIQEVDGKKEFEIPARPFMHMTPNITRLVWVELNNYVNEAIAGNKKLAGVIKPHQEMLDVPSAVSEQVLLDINLKIKKKGDAPF